MHSSLKLWEKRKENIPNHDVKTFESAAFSRRVFDFLRYYVQIIGLAIKHQDIHLGIKLRKKPMIGNIELS